MNIEKVLTSLTLEEKASLLSGADFWNTKAIERLGIPKVMMCDGPNGLRKQEHEADHLGIHESIKAVCFPTESAIASSFDVDLAKKLGEVLGRECQAENIGMLLGPGVNIKRSPLCGRNFEYFSEDPYQSSQMATAYIQGLQGNGVGACIKHFAVNNQETCRQIGDSVVDERTLHEIYLASFEDAIKVGKPWGVMCSYNQINGTFAAENKELLTDVLRKQWSYDGFVVTDWGAVKDRIKGVKAGMELEMPGGFGSLEGDKQVCQAVKDGLLSEEIVNTAVKRVLGFIKETVDNRQDGVIFDRSADYEVAEKIAEECAVLLKNENNTLPLAKESKVAFIGDFIYHPRYQGAGSSHINSAKTSVVSDILKDTENVMIARGFCIDPEEGNKKNDALLQEAINLAKNNDVAVIFAGLPDALESEGKDRTHMDLPQEQNRLIEEICRVQPNTVVVLSNGAPVTMPWVNDVQALLEMYLAGDGAAEAAINLLYGDVNPSGKLAESFPVRVEDNPSFLNFPGEKGVVQYKEDIFVGYRYYDKKDISVLFPFGHGLSYTSFAYSNLQLSKSKMNDGETLQATVSVTNTGKRKGKEVVQLYVGIKNSSVRRPIRELKGFQKVELESGETKDVTFTLNSRAFAYYEVLVHDWFVESGSYEISVGTSSRNLSEKADVEVHNDKYLPMKVTSETGIGDLLNHPATAPIMQQIINSAREQLTKGNEGMSSVVPKIEEAIENAMEMPFGILLSYGIMDENTLQSMVAIMQNAMEDYKKQ